MKAAAGGEVNPQSLRLTPPLQKQVDAALIDWQRGDKVRRLWARDASLWTGDDESSWLGWLDVIEAQLADRAHLEAIARDAQRSGFKQALLLGMGGSSLCPEVLAKTFGRAAGFPEFHVLDSTDPAQIKSIESELDLSNTLFIVSSKSGSTLEPNIFKQYFFDRVKQAQGEKAAGERFIAITDPGSKLEQIANAEGFRHVFHGVPSIGGRYSALSDFGMVPAAMMGIDALRLLERAGMMKAACADGQPIEKNPGVMLGVMLGALGNQGRNKVTFVVSPAVADLGAWLEQLIAESTGKQGKGLIPVDREHVGAPEVYGDDRIFAYLRYGASANADQDRAVESLEKAGQPVVRIEVADLINLGQEFYRWEIATAVAGSILGINAFNQPDVEASKVATRKLTSEYEKSASLPAETPFFTGDGIALFADEANVAELEMSAGNRRRFEDYLKAHLHRLGRGDYFAMLAYLEMNAVNENRLQAMRAALRDKKHNATCLGFGPRFLHSTGQAYKGGPNTGVFLQMTCDDVADLPVPGQKYTFGVVKAAQARGDFEVLAERKRRALRVHLGKDVAAGLSKIEAAFRQAF